MTKLARCIFLMAIVSLWSSTPAARAQVYDIFEFDETEEGPWSDIDHTTLMVPLVPDGSITLDGSPSVAEYGGFEGQWVTPGFADGSQGNAWILSFAQSKNWDGIDDSSFTFWLAHDTDFLYVGVDVKDDEVISNDPNPQFWKDDAIEIIVDAKNDRVNANTDEQENPVNDFGGHNYVNYEGRFSRWDEGFDEPIRGWSNAVEWEYGEEGQVFGVGGETDMGWAMEVKFHKSLFEDPDVGNKLEPGYTMGFNIGMDDDDGADLEVQYWWANRARPLEFDTLAWEDGDTISDYPPEDFDWVIDANGRLTLGATGEIIFMDGPIGGLTGDYNNNGELDAGDLDLQSQAIADQDLAFDLNEDGTVDFADRTAWVKDLRGTWIGDSNMDNEFNSGDLVAVFTAGKYELDQPATWAEGDWDGDMRFGSGDLVAAFTDGGFELGPRPDAAAAVPEPAGTSALLMSVTCLVLARVRLGGKRRERGPSSG